MKSEIKAGNINAAGNQKCDNPNCTCESCNCGNNCTCKTCK
jgi:hypothetical protein